MAEANDRTPCPADDPFAYARPDAKWPPDRPNLNNGDWERIGIAAGKLRLSEDRVRKLAPFIGKLVLGSWWISITRAMNYDLRSNRRKKTPKET